MGYELLAAYLVDGCPQRLARRQWAVVTAQRLGEVGHGHHQPVEQLVERHRRPAQDRRLALDGLEDLVGVEAVQIEQEDVGVQGVDGERLARLDREVLEVDRDHGLRAAGHRRREDVAVLPVVGIAGSS